MSTSFQNRLLRASLVLPQGNFISPQGNPTNTLNLEGFRMSAKLNGAGNFTNACNLTIFGMRQVDMNSVTVVFGQDDDPNTINTRALLILEAWTGSGYLQIFEGQFFEAQPDYKNLPDVALVIAATTAQGRQYLSAPPTSFNGSVPLVTVAAQLANQMGFPFENNGVTGSVQSPYFPGTLMDQFRQLAEAGRFDYYFDAKSTLIICARNQPRLAAGKVVINAQSGLIGYPTLNRYGIEIDALFQPAFELASPIEIQGSEVPGTNGLWFPNAFSHDLDAIVPGGRWQSHLVMQRFPNSVATG